MHVVDTACEEGRYRVLELYNMEHELFKSTMDNLCKFVISVFNHMTLTTGTVHYPTVVKIDLKNLTYTQSSVYTSVNSDILCQKLVACRSINRTTHIPNEIL